MTNAEQSEDLEVTFTGVHVHAANQVHVSSIVDEYAEERQDHALIFSWIDGHWTHRPIENSIGGLCVVDEPTPKVLNMGIDGLISVFNLPGFDTEHVDRSPDGPSYSKHLKCIRRIDGSVYVAGMARQVYRREDRGRWLRCDQGARSHRGRTRGAVGFCSIDGPSENEIYGVGYKGEIWMFDGAIWTEVASPTNILLTGVRCSPEGEVYACGLGGVILCGRERKWRIIEQDVTEKDFWGITIFGGSLYLSNYDGLFRLDDQVLRRVDLGLRKTITTAYLDSCNEMLWSVGHKDLTFTSDGRRWKHTPTP